jgi:hypothetical protein
MLDRISSNWRVYSSSTTVNGSCITNTHTGFKSCSDADSYTRSAKCSTSSRHSTRHADATSASTPTI